MQHELAVAFRESETFPGRDDRVATARAQLPTYLLEDQGDRCDKCGQTIK